MRKKWRDEGKGLGDSSNEHDGCLKLEGRTMLESTQSFVMQMTEKA